MLLGLGALLLRLGPCFCDLGPCFWDLGPCSSDLGLASQTWGLASQTWGLASQTRGPFSGMCGPGFLENHCSRLGMVLTTEMLGFFLREMDSMEYRRPLGEPVSPKTQPENCFTRISPISGKLGKAPGLSCIFPIGPLWACRPIQLLSKPEGAS